MPLKLTEQEINTIQYFWLERGDLERWDSWSDPKVRERIIASYPELEKAWVNYKVSQKLLTLIVENLD